MKALEHRILSLVEPALAERVFSGASLGVAQGETIVFSGSWGTTMFGPEGKPVTWHTPFDLASLTKPIATATLCMIFMDAGRLVPEDPLVRFFPSHRIPEDKRQITVEQLLSHRSGLPDYKPYFRDLIRVAPRDRKATLLNWILQEPLLARPGTIRRYSDLGYILLGLILEHISGTELDQLFADQIRPSPETWSLGYRRLIARTAADTPEFESAALEEDKTQCVATEQCPWRKRLIQGEVHDENAYCLNGVAGHAGLFGSARDVWTWAKDLLNLYRGKRSEALPRISSETIRFFLEVRGTVSNNPSPEVSSAAGPLWHASSFETPPGNHADPGSLPCGSPHSGERWCLGFDLPSPQGSSAGRFFSPHTVGHLGFTGTSFWMDLDREITVIFLTNRIHPHRHDERLRSLRPRLHDAIMEGLLFDQGASSARDIGGS